MKRILALDGGGVRGVFALQILARIEELFRLEHNNPDLVLGDIFDLIAGTSTGAIIAAFLSWGLPVCEIEKLYITHSPEMFAFGRWTERWKYKYNPDAIAGFFREQFKEKDSGTPALLGTKRLRHFLLIVMCDGSTGGAWPVSNNPAAKYNLRTLENAAPNLQCNLDIPLWQLLRASTAAPTYFPPEEILLGGVRHLFMDGGITPYNNPSLIAALMATLPSYKFCWPAGRDSLHVTSVGTGLARTRLPGKAAADVHLWDHIKYMAPALIGSIASEQDLLCRVLGDCVHGGSLDSEIGGLEALGLLDGQEQKFTYARYDHPLDARYPEIKQLPDGQIELDDISTIPLLKKLGKEYADEHVRKEHLHPRNAGGSGEIPLFA
jgi:hypothetical protein